MKRIHAFCALTGMIGGVMFASAAQAQSMTTPPPGPYISLGAGMNQPQAHSGSYITGGNPGTPEIPAKFSFDTGYDVAAALGWKWNYGIRTEVELSWRSAPFDRVNSIPWDGRERVGSAMGNVLYDINVGRGFTPYIGGGLGVGDDHFRQVTGPGSNAFPRAVFDDSDTRFQWQLIGGVSVPISNRMSLFADYRYIRLNNVNIGALNNPNSMILNNDDRSHNVLVGVRFALGK